MDSQELLKKIKRIELSARQASKQLFSGQYKSGFKGMGMEFAEVRQYFPGDETRAIDWNVTARLREPFVKTFEEERELSVMLLVDVSASSELAAFHQSKKEYIAEICAVLAFSANHNNDKVGVVFFTDRVEKYIPPGKGKQHVLRIIRDLLHFEPVNRTTDISAALSFFNNATKRSCSVFLVSDFLTDSYEKQLKLVRARHELMVISVADNWDKELLDLGWAYLADTETGERRLVDTSSEKTKEAFIGWRTKQELVRKSLFKKLGVDAVELNTAEPYLKPLKLAFSRR